MKTIKIGVVVTSKVAHRLCLAHGLFEIASRIAESPDQFKDWTFDGASCVNDAMVSRTFGIPNLTAIALIHDLKYAYGIPGDDRARMEADLVFTLSALRDGADPVVARAMFTSVQYGGCEELKRSFSWGFARV